LRHFVILTNPWAPSDCLISQLQSGASICVVILARRPERIVCSWLQKRPTRQGGRPLVGHIPFRTLCGRRVEENIKSRDLAVARDDEIHAGVLRRFAFRPRAPRQASRIVQNLGRAMRRINEMRMRRSEIASELVQRVVTDERAGRRLQHTVFGVKFLNCGPSAS
jgi:hypothetical protein